MTRCRLPPACEEPKITILTKRPSSIIFKSESPRETLSRNDRPLAPKFRNVSETFCDPGSIRSARRINWEQAKARKSEAVSGPKSGHHCKETWTIRLRLPLRRATILAFSHIKKQVLWGKWPTGPQIVGKGPTTWRFRIPASNPMGTIKLGKIKTTIALLDHMPPRISTGKRR